MDVKQCSKCNESKPLACFSKNKAKRDGLSHYCKLCAKTAMQAWRAANPGAAAAATAEWRRTSPDKARESQRKSDQKRAGRPDRKAMTAKAIAAWRRANAGLVNTYTWMRRAAQKQAIPLWADCQQVQDIYDLAAAWNRLWPEDPVNVDHIVPLVSDVVCGLHCHQNLRIIRKSVNTAKSNRWWPDMP